MDYMNGYVLYVLCQHPLQKSRHRRVEPETPFTFPPQPGRLEKGLRRLARLLRGENGG